MSHPRNEVRRFVVPRKRDGPKNHGAATTIAIQEKSSATRYPEKYHQGTLHLIMQANA
jgi:hypothetical protein